MSAKVLIRLIILHSRLRFSGVMVFVVMSDGISLCLLRLMVSNRFGMARTLHGFCAS